MIKTTLVTLCSSLFLSPLTPPGNTEDPGALIEAMWAKWQGVKDYTCIFSKQERINGKLLPEQILENAKSYKEQVFKILDPEKTDVLFNSDWIAPLGASGMLELTTLMNVARMLERDDFEKRYKSGTPISISEFIYPLLQGYDSVHLDSDIEIISRANDHRSLEKLKLAGANKVLAELQTASDLIIELLEKPVITRLMHEIMDMERDLQVAQVTLKEDSCAVGKYINEVLKLNEHNVILLAVVDFRMSESFIFTAKGYNHMLDPGDVLVVIGYDKDIKAFEQEIGGSCDAHRSHWSR